MPLSQSPEPPPLRLLPGALGDAATNLVPQPLDAEESAVLVVPITRRPGDHVELVSPGPSLASLRTAGRRRAICAETAVALALEHEMLCAALRDHGLGAGIASLTSSSRNAGVRVPLMSAHADYLRHLLGRSPVERSIRPLDSPRVAVPVRLVDRLQVLRPDLSGDPDARLAQAVEWEIAALLAGETMSEWAYRSLLATSGP